MPALEHISIDGYRSIKHADVELGQLNVVIGANGAGKSNLLGVLRLIADLADVRLNFHVAKAGGANALLHFGVKRTSELRIRLNFDSDFYELALSPTPGDQLTVAYEAADKYEYAPGASEAGLSRDRAHSAQLLRKLQGIRVFQFHDTTATSGFKQKQRVDDNRFLRSDGSNLAPYLFRLRQQSPERYRSIVEQVQAIAPFFDDFKLEPDAINDRVILLEWRHRASDQSFDVSALSDGTLRFICLVTLLVQPEKPAVIAIDEPELGLHPAAIAQLAALIRVAASDSQIILATQSVTLLDQFSSEDVIVVEQHDGESTFQRLAPDQVRGWLEDYSLGDLWLKNVLGGRPSR
ncbi:MAG TPA: AAA family ATPase [Kofleriaceae bacterium]|jgi:predicted ATPase